MLNVLRLLFLFIVITASGCATQGVSKFNYKQTSPLKVENELSISGNYSDVWDILVKSLSKSFYVINNIDKESRIINLSFFSENPENYIDCGKTHRTYIQGDKSEEYEYELAADSTFKIAAIRQQHPAFANYAKIRRTTTLDGRVNIYLAPDGKNADKTIISVNTRYILHIKVTGEKFAENVNGVAMSVGPFPETNDIISLNTNRPGEKIFNGEVTVKCYCKGKLEQDILDMTKGILKKN